MFWWQQWQSQKMKLTIFTAVLTTLTAVHATCPRDKYYSDSTKTCEWCLTLCENADIQGTTRDCLKHCPAYATPTAPTPAVAIMCPPHEYYNPDVSGCDQCFIICDQHWTQDTTEECRKRCPLDYMMSIDTTQIPVTGGAVKRDEDPVLLSIEALCLVILLLVAIICVGIFTSVLVFCPGRLPDCLQSCLPFLNADNKNNKRHPVECTQDSYTTGSTMSSCDDVAVTMPLRTDQDEVQPKMAFTDLQLSMGCSSYRENT